MITIILKLCVCTGTQLSSNQDKDECIKLSVAGQEQLVVLTGIAELEVCVDNPHFKQKFFKTL
nr:Rho-binding antiterminator [Vibrio sp. D173a]